MDRVLKVVEPYLPKEAQARHRGSPRFVTERLNGEDGIGAIFPAMANSVMMFDALGYPTDHPDRVTARASLDKLLVISDDEAYCQPCLSPVWDTALVAHALMEVGDGAQADGAKRALEWLQPLQVLDRRRLGCDAARRPAGRLGVPIQQRPLS